MAKAAEKKAPASRRSAPTLTPEAQEEKMINLAIKLAEKKLEDGTASNQMICHYLKLGSSKERLEKEILSEQKDLILAKTEALRSAKRMEELYANAIAAMRKYSVGRPSEEIEDEEDI